MRKVDDELGLRSRDEDPWADEQFQVAKRGASENMLKRNAGLALTYCESEVLGTSRGDRVAPRNRGPQLTSLQTEHVGEQDFGVRAWAHCAAVGKLARRSFELIAERTQCSVLPASAASVSAFVSASITSSKAPSST